MPVHEIESKRDFGPYSALLGSDSNDWISWSVRIQPPFQPGDFISEYFSGDNLDVQHVASAESATVLRFSYIDVPANSVDCKELAIEHTETLLQFLGEVSSKGLFIDTWSKFDTPKGSE